MAEIRDVNPLNPIWPRRPSDKVHPRGDESDVPQRERAPQRKRDDDSSEDDDGAGHIDEYV